MIRVAVSGAGGRMGRLVCETVTAADDLELAVAYDPLAPEGLVAGLPLTGVRDEIAGCEVVVEFTHPDVVMGNLGTWNEMGVHAVVGTSGFDAGRLADLRSSWRHGPPNCLVVPNFSIGAVVMMRLAEIAARHFAAAEIIELHHDRKADAPSGTAMTTAERISSVIPAQRGEVESGELRPGARGASVSGVRVHSVRLPGLVAHQEVLLGNSGETLSIRHDTTDRAAFMPGVMLAVRNVADLADPVTVGLEPLLGI